MDKRSGGMRNRLRAIIRQLLPLYHNPLITNINKHLKLVNYRILSPKLFLQILDLLLPLLLNLLHLALGVGDLGAQLGPELLLEGQGRLFVEGGELLELAGLDA